MNQIDTAARMAGDWWASKLHPDYREKSTEFAAAVAGLVSKAMRGEIQWVWTPCVFPSGDTGSVTQQAPGDGNPVEVVFTEFDYQADALLDDAITQALPEVENWNKGMLLPRKHTLDVYPDRLCPKEGYGNWTKDIPVPTAGS